MIIDNFQIEDHKLIHYLGRDNVVEIPNSITSLDAWVFWQSAVTSITIPNSVTTIDIKAFDNCVHLENINVVEDNTNYTSIDGVLYSKDKKTLIRCPEGKTGSFIIPNSVTSIGREAFFYCNGLTSVTIPNSVTSIGVWAFGGCKALTSISIPNSVTSIGSSAFCNCTGLTSVTIPNSVTSIESQAFYGCSGLTNIMIPDSVTSIGTNAFSDCKGLTSITIGNNVTSIESTAFYGCSALTSIKIPNSVTKIGAAAFCECFALTNIEIPDSVIYHVFKNIDRFWNNIFLGCQVKHKSIKNRVIAYKGFNSDMTCRDFQYEEGKTYICNKAKLCECGFHACLNPLDCFNYYYDKGSIYHEVILEDICNKTGEDSKICGKKITIGRRLTIKELFDIFNNLNKD